MPGRQGTQELTSESVLVGLDVLDEVEPLGLIELGMSGVGRISIRDCVAVGETHWLGLSLSGDEVRVWFKLSGDTWVPVCLGWVI